MRISLAKAAPQPVLFDREEYISIRGNHGLVRTVIGDFFEDLTATKFNGKRHRTDARCDYCPNVSNSEGYLEVKATGRSNQTLIYAGRLEKDLAFSNSNSLKYVIWSHSVATSQLDTVAQLRRKLAKSIRAVYVVPFLEIYRICKLVRETPLNSAYGHSDTNPIYGSGYRISLNQLGAFRDETLQVPCPRQE